MHVTTMKCSELLIVNTVRRPRSDDNCNVIACKRTCGLLFIAKIFDTEKKIGENDSIPSKLTRRRIPRTLTCFEDDNQIMNVLKRDDNCTRSTENELTQGSTQECDEHSYSLPVLTHCLESHSLTASLCSTIESMTCLSNC